MKEGEGISKRTYVGNHRQTTGWPWPERRRAGAGWGWAKGGKNK